VDEDEEMISLEVVTWELVEESTPSHEATRITNGKKIENRFITRNSQVDSK
jgi:hypothetical protein